MKQAKTIGPYRLKENNNQERHKVRFTVLNFFPLAVEPSGVLLILGTVKLNLW
jgi:hypothetical protein